MHRCVFVGAFLAVVLSFTGCSKSKKDPDQMTKEEFKVWLSEKMGMTDLSIKEVEPGRFTGTGIRHGKTWQIKVIRAARKASWEIKNEDGGTGTTEQGSREW